MKEKPIIFNAEMVRAILNTKPNVWPMEPIDASLAWKWQTRRVIKPQPEYKPNVYGYWQDEDDGIFKWTYQVPIETYPGCIYNDLRLFGKKGICHYQVDELWVRETWQYDSFCELNGMPGYNIRYRADDSYKWIMMHREDGHNNNKWRPSIHMPRWASRLQLAVKNVRVEQVTVISEVDAKAEGVAVTGISRYDGEYRDTFQRLWDKVYAKRGLSWDTKPWVWVVEFMRKE